MVFPGCYAFIYLMRVISLVYSCVLWSETTFLHPSFHYFISIVLLWFEIYIFQLFKIIFFVNKRFSLKRNALFILILKFLTVNLKILLIKILIHWLLRRQCRGLNSRFDLRFAFNKLFNINTIWTVQSLIKYFWVNLLIRWLVYSRLFFLIVQILIKRCIKCFIFIYFNCLHHLVWIDYYFRIVHLVVSCFSFVMWFNSYFIWLSKILYFLTHLLNWFWLFTILCFIFFISLDE